MTILEIHGDSIATGANATGNPWTGPAYPSNTNFPTTGDGQSYLADGKTISSPWSWPSKLIQAEKPEEYFNFAVGGNTANDININIYRQLPTKETEYVIAIGANDARLFTIAGGNGLAKSVSGASVLAAIAFLGGPSFATTLSNDAATVGTWSNGASGVWGFSKQSSTVNDTITFIVPGNAAVVGMVSNDPNLASSSGVYVITIDGQIQNNSIPFLSNAPITFNNVIHPSVTKTVRGLLFGDLGEGFHTVEIKITTAGAVEVGFVTGLHQNWQTDSQFVRVVNATRQTSGGYVANGGSDADVAAFNQILSDVVGTLRSYGANVTLVDVNSRLSNTQSDIDDGLHPGYYGHEKIFQAVLSSRYLPRGPLLPGLSTIMDGVTPITRSSREFNISTGYGISWSSVGSSPDANWRTYYQPSPSGAKLCSGAAIVSRGFGSPNYGFMHIDQTGKPFYEINGQGAQGAYASESNFSVIVVSPASGDTVSIPDGTAEIYIEVATTLTSLIVDLPSSPEDRTEVMVSAPDHGVNGLSVTSSVPIVGAPTSIAAASSFTMKYFSESGGKWMRKS